MPYATANLHFNNTNLQFLHNIAQALGGGLTEEATVAFERDAVNEDDRDFVVQDLQLNRFSLESFLEPVIQVRRHSVVEANVVVPGHHVDGGVVGVHCEQGVEPPDIIVELFWWTPLALVKKVSCNKNSLLATEIQGIHAIPRKKTCLGEKRVWAVWNVLYICHSLLSLSAQWPSLEPRRWVSARIITGLEVVESMTGGYWHRERTR